MNWIIQKIQNELSDPFTFPQYDEYCSCSKERLDTDIMIDLKYPCHYKCKRCNKPIKNGYE